MGFVPKIVSSFVNLWTPFAIFSWPDIAAEERRVILVMSIGASSAKQPVQLH